MEKTVLVVEDDAIVQSYVINLLREAGIRTVGARSGKEGVALARAHPPDLILVDYYLPGTDGLEVLRLLRGEQQTRHIPFLFISSGDHPAMIRRIKEAGADDYLTKPFDPGELVRRIQRLLSPPFSGGGTEFNKA